jgi:hypothetical protein
VSMQETGEEREPQPPPETPPGEPGTMPAEPGTAPEAPTCPKSRILLPQSHRLTSPPRRESEARTRTPHFKSRAGASSGFQSSSL